LPTSEEYLPTYEGIFTNVWRNIYQHMKEYLPASQEYLPISEEYLPTYGGIFTNIWGIFTNFWGIFTKIWRNIYQHMEEYLPISEEYLPISEEYLQHLEEYLPNSEIIFTNIWLVNDFRKSIAVFSKRRQLSINRHPPDLNIHWHSSKNHGCRINQTFA
jgi:hypothetical protein